MKYRKNYDSNFNILAQIKKIKKFETNSDPEFAKVIGQALTIANQWKITISLPASSSEVLT